MTRSTAWTFAVLAWALGSLLPLALEGQQSAVADSSLFRALDLPAPNDVRTGSGRPGVHYWQQRVDYRIDATLDVAKNELTGRETIHYQNNSPDRLTYLWMHV